MALPAWEAAGDGDVKHQKVLLLLKAGNTEEEVAVSAYAPVLSSDWGTAPVPGIGASLEAMGFSIPFLQDPVGQSGALTFFIPSVPHPSFLIPPSPPLVCWDTAQEAEPKHFWLWYQILLSSPTEITAVPTQGGTWDREG